MSNKNSSLDIKGNQVKPIIIEFDEEDHIKKQSQSLIKKMLKQNNSSIKYSGGYQNKSKVGSVGANASNYGEKVAKKDLYRPEESEVKQDVYGQLGVSKVQSKYRVIDQNNKIKADQNYSISNLQQKIQLLKQDRTERNNSLLKKVDTYTISNNKDRYQNISHVQSSLDVINIQNIQAKLEAHRRNLRHVEQEYNAKKGKQMPIDRYGFMKVNIDVDRQYAELGVDQDKVYQLVRRRENLEPGEVQFQELWEERKRNDPKLAEYDAKFQQYLITKDAKNLVGGIVRNNLFQWDKYKQPNSHKVSSKVKLAHRGSVSPSKQHKRSKQKQQLNNSVKYGPDGLASIKDIQDVLANKDDKFIASYIFAQLDTGKVGLISKEELHDYILSQEHIINGYNIDTKWLYTDLDNYQTSRKGMLSKQQLAIFLATLQKLDHPKLSLTNKSSLSMMKSAIKQGQLSVQDKKGILSTFPKYRPLFEKLFNTLDFNDDKLIKRAQFIENIYIDSDCVKILDQEVIKIVAIGKGIKVRQIIGFILDDFQKQRNQKLKKSKEYITFNRFCQYFEIPESLDLSKIDKTSIKKKQDKSTQFDIFDLPQEYLQLLKDIFNEIPRIYQDYIVCSDFIQAALRDPQILALGDELCRLASVQTGIQTQSLQTTLHRMQRQCDQYGTWESIKLFFSRRGRPLDWDYALITQKKQLRAKKLKQQRQGLSKQKLRQTQRYFEYQGLKSKSKQKGIKGPNRYTIPQPFDITDMKQKPKQEIVHEGQLQFEQLKKQFKAQPVNQQILQPKPELIMGKVKKDKSEQKRAQYKYENYENDRIERALKRAQQQYQKNEMIKTIIDKTQVKAKQVEIDLKKKYDEVIKQQEKKRREKSKYKPTNPKASESLYPPNPAEQRIKKIENVKENLEKGDIIAKRKKQQLEEDAKKVRDKNLQKQKLVDQTKKRQEEEKKKRDKLATDGLPFKPNINKKELTDKQRQAIEKARQQKERKKKEEQERNLRMIEERKKKILEYEKKPQFVSIQGLTDEQIIQNLDFINFEDLLLDEKDKAEYRKQFDNQNKTLKQLKERESGLAGRERAAMEQEEKRIMEEKRKYKEKVQKQKTQGDFTKSNVKGQKAVYENDLNFNKSKALRRYRALMEGVKPNSEFDKYSMRGSEKGISVQQNEEQEQTFSQQVAEADQQKEEESQQEA